MKQMKNNKKNYKIDKGNEGITLIALIITIIVMLILVAVTINLAVNGGLFGYAGNAARDTEIAKEKEIITMACSSAMAKKASEGDLTPISASDLNQELASYGATASGDNPITILFEESKRQYTIDGSGNVDYEGKSDITIAIRIEGDDYLTKTQVKSSKIPSGFYYVGGDISTGLVISDAQADQNKYENSNTVGVDLVGNQFVWVPVKQNQKIKISVESEDEITNIHLFDPFGNIIDLGISGSIGNTYTNNNINPTINGRYVLAVKKADNYYLKELWVNSLYAKDTFADTQNSNQYSLEIYDLTSIKDYVSEDGIYHYYGYDDLEDFLSQKGFSSLEEILQYYGCNNIYEYYGCDSFEDYFGSVVKTCEKYEYFDEWENDEQYVAAYTTSVNDNGGFYIGRYEAGKSSLGTAVCKVDEEPYNMITRSSTFSAAKEINNNCTLPTGAVYDRIIRWIVECDNNISLYDVAENSSNIGNIKSAQFEVTRGKYTTNTSESMPNSFNPYQSINGSYTKTQNSSVLFTTGACPDRNVTNNIFDLSGNLGEMTTEGDVESCLYRGVQFSRDKAMAYRDGFAYTVSSGHLGFRPVMFLPEL